MKLIEGNFLEHTDELVAGIKSGKLFIYPTDTIYGIGCDATNKKAVDQIRSLKHRETKPMLVIAPNLDWIWDNCELTHHMRAKIESKLPGRYAFFVKLKNEGSLAYKSVNPLNDGTIGVRMIDHAFQTIVTSAGRPFVTTSVNLAGEHFSQTIAEMPDSIKMGVDYVIDAGELAGPPSQRIKLTN